MKDKGREKPAYLLMYKLLDLVFTLDEMADSRGTGMGIGDLTKPVLNQEKIMVLKSESFITNNIRLNTFTAIFFKALFIRPIHV